MRSNSGLFRIVSEINGDFSRKTGILQRLYLVFAPANGVLLKFIKKTFRAQNKKKTRTVDVPDGRRIR